MQVERYNFVCRLEKLQTIIFQIQTGRNREQATPARMQREQQGKSNTCLQTDRSFKRGLYIKSQIRSLQLQVQYQVIKEAKTFSFFFLEKGSEDLSQCKVVQSKHPTPYEIFIFIFYFFVYKYPAHLPNKNIIFFFSQTQTTHSRKASLGKL